MIIERLRRIAPPGTIIPKPQPNGSFFVKGDGMRRGEYALIYTIPNHSSPLKPYQKGITVTELENSYERLINAGKLTRPWFKRNLPECDKEGPCNFTTVGGLFVLLGKARYEGRGLYQCT